MAEIGMCALSGSVSFEVSKISELKEKYTPEFMVEGIPWNVSIEKKLVDGTPCLAAYLFCTKKEKPLLQPAIFSINLLSFNANVAPIERHVQPFIYDNTEYGFGSSNLITWDNLLDAAKGYVKNNTIKFEFHVEVADQNEDTKSNLICANIEKNCAGGCSTKYRLTVTNIKNLMAVRPSKIIIQNVPWYMVVCKTRSAQLGVYLDPYEKEGEIASKIKISIKLLSSNGTVKSIETVEKIDGITSIPMIDIVSWTELLKSKNGFIENGSIIMEVGIKVMHSAEVGPSDGDDNIRAKRSKLECAICMEDLEDKEASSVSCGHTFCTSCIKAAIEKSNRCPMCNTPANVDDLRRCLLPISN